MRWILIALLAAAAAGSAPAQSLPIDLFLTYQFAPADSADLQRTTHSTSVSVSPTTFDQLVSEVREKRDEAPVFQQVLKELVAKHQLPRLLFPEVLVLREGTDGPTQRLRFPSSGTDVILYDRQRILFFEGQSVYDYVKRNTRGTKKLFGPGLRR